LHDVAALATTTLALVHDGFPMSIAEHAAPVHEVDAPPGAVAFVVAL
jgi:hypothetical protein